MLRSQIKKDIEKVVSGVVGQWDGGIEVTRTADEKFGDYSSNIALRIATRNKKQETRNKDELYQSPMEFAKILADSLKSQPYLEKLEVKEPGFINFFIKDNIWQKEVEKLLNKKAFGSPYSSKKIIVEFTDPNPFKEFHVGHLYSNSVGEAISRMFEALGAQVKRANYQGDVGLHVAKCVWGMRFHIKNKKLNIKNLANKNLGERIDFLGLCYAAGAEAYETDAKAKEEIIKINQEIYEKQDVIIEYKLGKAWSLENFEAIYKRLGTRFDLYYFESEVGTLGVEIVKKNLGRVFEMSKGAVIFPGEKYGLHNRVFITGAGLPTYEAKELGLAFKKYEDFAYNLSIIVTGNEIAEYFKVLLAAIKQVGPAIAKKTQHVAHGMVRMPGGKISSRLGNVISASWILDEAGKRALEFARQSEKGRRQDPDKIAEVVAVGAVKYAFLKGNASQDIKFSFEEAMSLEGNSGPYLQYTHARCRSVLEKGRWVGRSVGQRADFSDLANEERILLRALGHFEEVVVDAASSFAPNQIAGFLFEVAQKYNAMYNNLRIIDSKEPDRSRRLFLTHATAKILEKGLNLLGISAPGKM
ncbi:arginine--tRNA ligase [Candidatus Curtissbacteria bacterium RIFCSPLOWO2_01_FULL_41_18]|uniref:Arginine--tRNA ligase n=1 Tax=Candidatus Curtissbacteria bacterium RIFCSPLOWO2_01_FULL_41_18 TaxID=1797727 RepID=A0A1F5HMI1_9BACT|nr:MAG: arginine--tRNA ligase [Candidatus Curtissbacteria bacterium RIFCSPLOWO2_01_FULL_41_18]